MEAVEGGSLRFARVAEEAGGGRLVFRSRRVQLPAGEYRARIESANALAWHFFQVLPLAERSRSPVPIPGRREDATNLASRFGQPDPLPLRISYDALDSRSGERIDRVVPFIRADGRWRRLTGSVAETLSTGGRYELRFSAAGYESEIGRASCRERVFPVV